MKITIVVFLVLIFSTPAFAYVQRYDSYENEDQKVETETAYARAAQHAADTNDGYEPGDMHRAVSI